MTTQSAPQDFVHDVKAQVDLGTSAVCSPLRTTPEASRPIKTSRDLGIVVCNPSSVAPLTASHALASKVEAPVCNGLCDVWSLLEHQDHRMLRDVWFFWAAAIVPFYSRKRQQWRSLPCKPHRTPRRRHSTESRPGPSTATRSTFRLRSDAGSPLRHRAQSDLGAAVCDPSSVARPALAAENEAKWVRWHKTRAEVFGSSVPWEEGWAIPLILGDDAILVQISLAWCASPAWCRIAWDP